MDPRGSSRSNRSSNSSSNHRSKQQQQKQDNDEEEGSFKYAGVGITRGLRLRLLPGESCDAPCNSSSSSTGTGSSSYGSGSGSSSTSSSSYGSGSSSYCSGSSRYGSGSSDRSGSGSSWASCSGSCSISSSGSCSASNSGSCSISRESRCCCCTGDSACSSGKRESGLATGGVNGDPRDRRSPGWGRRRGSTSSREGEDGRGGRGDKQQGRAAAAAAREPCCSGGSGENGSSSRFFSGTRLRGAAHPPAWQETLQQQQQQEEEEEDQQQQERSSRSSSRWRWWERSLQQLRRQWRRARTGGWRWCHYNEKSTLLFINSLLLIISATANPVLFKNMLDKLPNYSCFVSQATTFAVTTVFFLATTCSSYCGSNSTEVKDYPHKKLAFMGLLDSVSGMLMVVGGVHTSGMLQVVLGQICIVVSFAASVAILRKRYHLTHYLGACVIILGVFIVQWPSFRKASASQAAPVNLLSYNIIFSLAMVPIGLSAVYKEVAFRGVSLDINYLQAWVGFYQFFLGFLFLPLQSLPALGPEAVPLEKLPRSLWSGVWCLLGYDSVVANCGGPDEPPCDSCAGAWVVVSLYLAVNVLYNLFATVVLKLGGAALQSLIFTFRLPLSAFAFSSSLIMGNRAVPVQVTDVCGLVVLLMGLGIYRVGSLRRKRSRRRRLAAAAAAAADEEDAPPPAAAAAGGRTGATAGSSPFLKFSSSRNSSSTSASDAWGRAGGEHTRPAAGAVREGGGAAAAEESLRATCFPYRSLNEEEEDEEEEDEDEEDEDEEDEEDQLTEVENLHACAVAPEPTHVHLRRPLGNVRPPVEEAGNYWQLPPADVDFPPFSVKVTSPSGDAQLRVVRQPNRHTPLPR